MSSRTLGQMTEQDLVAIENAIVLGKPLKDLQTSLMKKASAMDAEEIVEKLGDKVPVEVSNMVRATKTQRAGQPFTEEALTKARNVLNGMIFDAQLALDQKLIECKTFEIMNRGTLAQVNNDLARLASQISDLAKMQSESRGTMGDSDSGIAELEEKIKTETKAYNLVKAEDDIEMVKRKADVAIAEFILGITICSDKKPALFQKGGEPGTIGIMKCEGDAEEFRFEDPKIEAQAQKALTPEARRKLRRWLGDVHDHALLQKGKKTPDEDADDFDELDADADDIETSASHAQVSSSAKQKPGEKKEVEAPKAPPVVVAVKVEPPKNPKPDPLKPPKCVLSKTNCGLLHDNMSLLWGQWKDLVDILQAKMDQDKADFDDTLKNLNQEIQTFVTAKGTAETSLAEATGKTNSDTEEQGAKQKEGRGLEKKFNEVIGECKEVISEIVFTDICGVKVVRAEVAKFSKEVGCAECKNQIIDCEVDDWIPGLCSVPCDDECKPDGMKQDGSGKCGGTQVLTRQIVAKNNEFGIKCVPLQANRDCSQLLCPVNCGLSTYSGWTKCTKECEQGLQQRTRSLVTKPKNGGEQCDTTQEARSCNTGSCLRDCTLKKWTQWTPCSQACGKGFQERYRHINVPVRGDGKCAKKTSKHRFEKRHCNEQPCVGDEKCLANMDVILAIDASGSLRESGYQVLKDFTTSYIDKMKSKAYGRTAVQVGAIQFGNGQLIKDGTETTISRAKKVSDLTAELDKVKGKIEATTWEKGFTNLAQVFTEADEMTMRGRKKAYTQLVIISDGKPSFLFSTKNEAQKLKSKGVNVFFVNINSSPNKNDVEYLHKEIVSQPWQVNYLSIPGVKKLKREMDRWASEALVQTCPKALSPSQVAAQAEAQGFKLVKEGQWCGETAKSKPNKDPLHQFLGVVPSPAECMTLVAALEGKFFSYGTETGKAPNNKGMCYMETTKDGDACPEKWVNGPTNYYKVLPLEIAGEGPPKK